MALRFSNSLLIALLVTGAMFWFMWVMISGGGHDVTIRPIAPINFTPLRHDTEVVPERIKPKLPKIENPPEIPVIERGGVLLGENNPMSRNEVDTEVGREPIVVSRGDQDVMPLVRINPEYPRRQLVQGIEGWVQVEFAITPAGSVSGVKVVDSEPKGLFDDAATDAVLRWKYNPRVVDGRAVERRGVRVVLRFDLED
jgi:periplasmic protein TonB